MSSSAFDYKPIGDESWEAISGRLRHVLDAADVGLWRLHLPTQLATWDEVASRIIEGVTRSQLTPVPLPIHPDDQELVLERLRLVDAGTGKQALTIRLLRPDGTVRWIRASARRPAGAERDCPWVVGLVSDVTAEQLAHAAIVEGKRQLATLVDHLPGIAYRCELKEPWRFNYVSEGVQALTGYSSADFTAGKLAWAALMHSDDMSAVIASVAHAIAVRSSFDLTYRLISADGGVHWVQERGRAYYEDGEPQFLEGFIWDISAAKEAEEQTRWIANHDPLTALPNRLLFQETIDAKISSRDTRGFSVLLLDVDDFKRTNDTLGHDAGDTLLREFARRLRSILRDCDLVARLGGDEFAILLDGIVEQQGIAAVGHKILETLSMPFQQEMGLLTCSASIGASISGRDGQSRTELLKRADIALYAAKAAGRSNLKLFSNHMLNEVQVRNSMLALAGSAIESQGIVPHYQPKVALSSGEIVGFEALLRWRSSAGDLRLPHDISAAFDDPLLAEKLSDRMLDAVIRDVRGWLNSGTPFGHVALNASPAQFRRRDFAERLLDRLAAANVPPSCIQVEVTETVFLGRGSRYVEAALTELDAAGVRIALDDFGTGYASLLHLAQYPVRTLKIDRSFVHKMISSQQDDAIIQAVISLGHSLGMAIVAEGVETLAQEARLRAKNCDFAQGFLYAPALAAEQVPPACRTRERVCSY